LYTTLIGNLNLHGLTFKLNIQVVKTDVMTTKCNIPCINVTYSFDPLTSYLLNIPIVISRTFSLILNSSYWLMHFTRIVLSV